MGVALQLRGGYTDATQRLHSCCRDVTEGKFFCLFEHDPFESENEHRNNPSVKIVSDVETTEGNYYLSKTIQRPDKLELIKLSDIDEAKQLEVIHNLHVHV